MSRVHLEIVMFAALEGFGCGYEADDTATRVCLLDTETQVEVEVVDGCAGHNPGALLMCELSSDSEQHVLTLTTHFTADKSSSKSVCEEISATCSSDVLDPGAYQVVYREESIFSVDIPSMRTDCWEAGM